ncbi:MAG: sugar kinase [Cytophagales bacterium]|nr:sugar kinase [Cytophagales bacterium]
MDFEKVIIIRDKTRLEQLIERFNSKAQARFYLEQSGGDFQFYEDEHIRFYEVLKQTQETVSLRWKTKVIDRSFLPTYLFSEQDLIMVIGQDGLVANTAKYVKSLPVVAINPNPDQYDGILLPYQVDTVQKALQDLVQDQHHIKRVTLAEALLSDGQRLLAFNDFYLGAASHVSSRYEISYKGKTELQSSSGILISTGVGSTGWLSSVFNMARNIRGDQNGKIPQTQLGWEDEKLVFVVREPFLSKTTGTNIGYGNIYQGNPLKVTSQMPSNGVIFSDGIESDFMAFNAGSTVTFGIAQEKAHLVF